MATGANYPTSFDSYANKVTGDYLTVADVNSRSDAIEALETGPLRPSDGSAGAPAYSFQNDTDTGIFRATTNTLDIVAGGIMSARFNTIASGINYLALTPSAAGGGANLSATGTDTNVSMVLQTKGTGFLYFFEGSTERFRVDAGRLLLGTTVATGSSGGDVVVPNARNFRGINIAGTSAKALIGMDVGDHVTISGDGQDIKWGVTLISMGGGAPPTLGTIGAAGPATATQNAWLRILDSGSAPMWVPVWK